MFCKSELTFYQFMPPSFVRTRRLMHGDCANSYCQNVLEFLSLRLRILLVCNKDFFVLVSFRVLFFKSSFLTCSFLVPPLFCLSCICHGGGPGSSPASRAVVYRVHISLRTNKNTIAKAKRKSCVGMNDNEVLKRINDVKFEQLSVGFPWKGEKT